MRMRESCYLLLTTSTKHLLILKSLMDFVSFYTSRSFASSLQL
uniref:Uncharacterized protein n=1 Tax=Rhizophora mucronata TaxID=61149 RepID=A0A2P2QBB0_RHIMU